MTGELISGKNHFLNGEPHSRVLGGLVVGTVASPGLVNTADDLVQELMPGRWTVFFPFRKKNTNSFDPTHGFNRA